MARRYSLAGLQSRKIRVLVYYRYCTYLYDDEDRVTFMEVSSALSSKPDDIKNNFTSNSLRFDFGPIVIDLTARFISVIATSICDTSVLFLGVNV